MNGHTLADYVLKTYRLMSFCRILSQLQCSVTREVIVVPEQSCHVHMDKVTCVFFKLYNLLQWITIVKETDPDGVRDCTICKIIVYNVYIMTIVLLMVLHFRASNLCEAAQKCGGAGRRECEVPLCRSRRPRSHCALEERWLRPAQGQVTHNGWRANWASCCITLLS